MRKQHGDAMRQALEELCSHRNQLLAALATLHLNTPEPTTAPQYEKQPFASAPPHLTTVHKLLALIWPPFKRRQERLHEEWENDRRAWEAAERHRHETETRLVFTSTTAIEETLSRYLSEIDWPKPPDISFDLGSNISTIALDLQLPNEDEMPDKAWSLPRANTGSRPKHCRPANAASCIGIMFMPSPFESSAKCLHACRASSPYQSPVTESEPIRQPAVCRTSTFFLL
jgi:hypothetical protein